MQQLAINEYSKAKQVAPTWTMREEWETVHKVDLRIIPWLAMGYTALSVDRINLNYAVIMNAENKQHMLPAEVGLTGNQFNWALSVFFIGYVLLGIPSNLFMTKYSPSRWMAYMMVAWGIATAIMASVHSFVGLSVVRAIAGCCEAGFAPGTALYLAFWYQKYEVSTRWAAMFGISLLITGFGGLVAYAIANMDGILGLSGWRWLFILEGAASVLLGIGCPFVLPDYPQTARFLTIAEKEIIIGRLPPTGPSMLTKSIKKKEVLDSLTDWRLYALGVSLMLTLMTIYSTAYFIPTVLVDMGFQSTSAQLLSIGPQFIAAVWIVTVNWSSDHFQEKSIHGVACFVPSIVGFFILGTSQQTFTAFTRYGVLFLVMLSEGAIPLIIGLSIITSKGTSRTALRSAFTIALGSLGGAFGSQIYQPDDAPLYSRGHYVNGGVQALGLIVFLIAVWSLARHGEFSWTNTNATVVEVGGLQTESGELIGVEQLVNAIYEVELAMQRRNTARGVHVERDEGHFPLGSPPPEFETQYSYQPFESGQYVPPPVQHKTRRHGNPRFDRRA